MLYYNTWVVELNLTSPQTGILPVYKCLPVLPIIQKLFRTRLSGSIKPALKERFQHGSSIRSPRRARSTSSTNSAIPGRKIPRSSIKRANHHSIRRIWRCRRARQSESHRLWQTHRHIRLSKNRQGASRAVWTSHWTSISPLDAPGHGVQPSGFEHYSGQVWKGDTVFLVYGSGAE